MLQQGTAPTMLLILHAAVTPGGCCDGSGFGEGTVSRGNGVASVITSYECSGNITKASGSILS